MLYVIEENINIYKERRDIILRPTIVVLSLAGMRTKIELCYNFYNKPYLYKSFRIQEGLYR